MDAEMLFKNFATPRPNTVTFQLAPTHVSYANTLVRLIETGVEMVGFRADIKDDGSTSDVVIEANSTPMTNEMLAHRIGLLPIHVTEPTKWDSEKYEFILDVTNDTMDLMNVKAGDFQVLEVQGDGTKVPVPSTRFFQPDPITKDTCLIARLRGKKPGGKAEELRLKAKATVGIGREHVRFTPTCHCAPAVWTRDTDPVKRKQAFEQWLMNHKKIDAGALPKNTQKKPPWKPRPSLSQSRIHDHGLVS